MKALIRMYSDQGKDVIFYENAASPQRKKHAAIVAVPLPIELGETAPAYFRVRYYKPLSAKLGIGRGFNFFTNLNFRKI